MKRRSFAESGYGDPAAGPSQRQLRVGEELRHTIAQIIERAHFRDPMLQGVSITVTEVRVSPDLKNATAYVTPLGGGAAADVVAALGRAVPYFRGQIARAVKLRAVPGLTFQADTSFDYAARISGLLQQPTVARDLTAEEGDEPADPPRDAAAAEKPPEGGGRR